MDGDAAVAEAQQLGSGFSIAVLKVEAQKADHTRSEKFKNHFERIAVCALYFLAGGAFLFSTIWVWHILTPIGWHWLDPGQLTRIQNLVTGGLMVGVVADHFRRRMN